jgi:prephenate dehydrogenase
VICSPVSTIVPLIESIAPYLKTGALITDVGSTKSLVVRQARQVVPAHATFVGSHPMAGSEKSGLEHAEHSLFYNRPCFVTPIEDTPSDSVEKIVALWKRLSMEVMTVSPETHDEIVAHISHLPHIMASMLCTFLADKPQQWNHFSGSGLRDTTRIAAGSPSLWTSILEQNREEILRSIDGLDAKLATFRSALANSDFHTVTRMLEQGKIYRDHLRPL